MVLYLDLNFTHWLLLTANQEALPHGNLIDSIHVVDFSGPNSENTPSNRLEDVQLDVEAYELYDSDLASSSSSPPGGHVSTDNDTGDDSSKHIFHVSHLPSKSFEGLWNSLAFEDPMASHLLRFISRMMSLMRNPTLRPTMTNWNRLLLLHGPPGSGKTTLCRALAQKLSIRLGNHFTQSRFVEVDSHCLLSKWFGESSKLVEKMFQQIYAIAADESTLVCVLIDEVESLAGSREKSVSGNEVGDALRMTNQLLTALDKIRHKPNVMVFCTTNLLSAVASIRT